MPLHENFKEYTEKEILEIKEHVCDKHKCPYFGVYHNAMIKKSCNKKTKYSNMCCNYFEYTGKLRDCMPDECTHYNDKNVYKPTFADFALRY